MEDAQKTELTAFDVPYLPRSKGRSASNLIPTNMATAAQKALDRLEQSVGDIDEFVRQRLGYDATEQLWQSLYAEQIDAIALSFHQRDRGNIFLNGDKTGNGKGRFGAANLVDVYRSAYIPVFVTQKANLYAAMLTDLTDIGKPGFRVFATDNNLTLELEDGRRLMTGDAAEQATQMRLMMESGLGRYDAIFTTYTQLQTVNQQEPFRREFFRGIASRAVFVFDESHEAGGSTAESGTYLNRAEFVRELVDAAAGAVFMSATAIKHAGVVDLYARRSDARYAVDHLSSLEIILKNGGVPLQQMFATKFVASGQMLRRSRSMEGISFTANVVPVDHAVAEDISAIMRAVNEFDEAKQKGLKELKKQLRTEAKALSADGSIGQTGARSTNFTSLMHNAIDQSLLAQKAEVAVQTAIAALNRGEKPLIGVANTMDSFIRWYTEENNIEPGKAITITFGDILDRYLERSRDVVISDRNGIKSRRRLTDEELGADGALAYEMARSQIESTDLSSIPLSSIDYIRWRLTQEGYRVDEITGRSHIVEYGSRGETSYGLRPASETTAQARNDIIDRFNRGNLDVIILNRSGATGINLHASEKFLDQRPRRMIIAQPERDINLVMQLFGRIDRYGQVVKPSFELLMSDLPAEKRLGALLAKKLAELNANVTASRESDFSIANVVDFMNVYGEEVVTEILRDDYELQMKLGNPLDVGSDDSEIAVIKRVTGRIPLLTIQEQESLYRLIEAETQDLIAQKEAMGENVLRADRLDLDARAIAQVEVIPDESGMKSEFTGAVTLEVVDAKVPEQPFTQLQVMNTVRSNLALETISKLEDHYFGGAERVAREQAQDKISQLRQDTTAYRRRALEIKRTTVTQDRFEKRLNEQFKHVSRMLRELPPGTAVRVVSPEGNFFYGVVAQIHSRVQDGNPVALNQWRMRILLDHHSRQITIPLSKLNRGVDSVKLTVKPQRENASGEDIYESFDLHQQQNQRTEMQIFTGNPIRAYEKYPHGKFLNYTNAQGEVLQGLIMPMGFDIEESLRSLPVTFKTPQQVQAFLTAATNSKGVVKTADALLTIRVSNRSSELGFVLQTPKSEVGDRYALDADLIAIAGSDFYSVNDQMELKVPPEQIEAVLAVLMQQKNYTLVTFDFKDEARSLVGAKLPELRRLELPVAETEALVESDAQIEIELPSTVLEPPRSQIENTTDFATKTEQARQMNLSEVAEQLGLQKDRYDKNKWKTAQHIISINDGKFYDWLAEKGGGGAIDLVMHVQDCSFKTAVEWLSGQPFQQQPMTESEVRSLELPQPDPATWSNVRQYLVDTRGLRTDWIDHLHARGLIYADDRSNVVFLRHALQAEWVRGEATGANLRGTHPEQAFFGLAPGTVREEGWFWLRSSEGDIQRIILVESPIDALSLALLEREKRPDAEPTIYLSTDGAGAIPLEILRTHLEQGKPVIAAHDTDAAGEKFAWRLAQALPGIKRMAPACGKDWNDRLLAEKQGKSMPDPGVDKQTLRELWKWHRVANQLGQQANYLARIATVAQEFVDGQPLSDKALAAMQQDFQTQQQQTQVQHAQTTQQTQAKSESPQPKKSCPGVELG
jgi:C-terminal domain on Strawberry notch homologue/Toprim-like/P-loop containing NTP hydrolase pore-1/Protein of unknown function (DUF3991)